MNREDNILPFEREDESLALESELIEAMDDDFLSFMLNEPSSRRDSKTLDKLRLLSSMYTEYGHHDAAFYICNRLYRLYPDDIMNTCHYARLLAQREGAENHLALLALFELHPFLSRYQPLSKLLQENQELQS